MESVANNFLESAIKRLSYYKDLCDKTFGQLGNEADFYFQPSEESNSIAIIIQHVAGNMLSRWTDFLITDGEKEWRDRDIEFTGQQLDKKQLIAYWEKGWNCCLSAISALQEEDLLKTIYIRSEGLSVVDAINRQLAHYPYHVGQIIYIAKILRNKQWASLSIPKNSSSQFNEMMRNGK